MSKFVGFDIESTGVNPKVDRIVTFSMVKSDDTDNPLEWFINPGVDIPEGASNVHGITNDVAKNWPDPPGQLSHILDEFRKCYDEGYMFTAYNCTFDLTMLRAEMRRHRVLTEDSTELEDIIYSNGILDPLVIDKAIDRYRRGSRKLIDTAAYYGFSLTNAHNATADVTATLFLADTFYRKLGEGVTVKDMMDAQARDKRVQAESLSEYFKSQGREDWEVSGDWPFEL